MMKILQIHVDYTSSQTSGENSSVRELESILASDFEVTSIYQKFDNELNFLQNFKQIFKFRKDIIQKCRSFDIIVIHNTTPFLDSFLIWKISKMMPIVKVWHNYRVFCMAGIQYRRNRKCFLCSKKFLMNIPGVFFRCYRKSFLLSAYMAFEQYFLRFLFASSKNIFHVAISKHMRHKLKKILGVSKEVYYIPHPYVPSDYLAKNPRSLSVLDALILGRVSDEKGHVLLLEAWKRLDLTKNFSAKLHVVGDGPKLDLLRETYASKSIIFWGFLDKDDIQKVVRNCRYGIAFSMWDEPFGKVFLEYLDYGLDILVSNNGALPELVDDFSKGLVFNGSTVDELVHFLEKVWIGENQINSDHTGAPHQYSLMHIQNAWKELLKNVSRK